MDSLDLAAVELRVKKELAYQSGIPHEKITNDMSMISDLGMDSLDWVELVMAVEDEFRIIISDDDAEQLATVQQAIDHVAKLLNPAAASA